MSTFNLSIQIDTNVTTTEEVSEILRGVAVALGTATGGWGFSPESSGILNHHGDTVAWRVEA